MSLTPSRVASAESFAGLRSEWNALLDQSASRSVFLTWEWLYAWWESFSRGRTLCLIEVRDASNALRGIAPLCIERRGPVASERVVSFLGTERVSSEYLDLIAAPGDVAMVASAVWKELLSTSREWDRLEWTDLLPDATALLVQEYARSAGLAVSLDPCQDCPYLALPGDEESFWLALGPEMRASIRRKTRKLESVGFAVRILEEGADIERALGSLFDLHALRWAERDRRGNFRDDRVRRFHRRFVGSLASQGRIRVGTIARGPEVVAALYVLHYKDVVSYYQSGFDPEVPDSALRANDYSPGLVLIGQLMRDAARRGAGEFDFLRGWEAYKRRWTETSRRTWTLTATQPGAWRTGLHRGTRRAAGAAKSVAKRILGRGRAARAES
jgi:CelD/BcsL family acetyltransferase involved in cellulose biosynthesis